MNKQLSPIRFGWLCSRGLFVLLFLLAACTPPTTPVTPQVELAVQTDQQQITVGNPVAIVMSLNPPSAIAEATWTVLSGAGDLEEKSKNVVVFTPSEESDLTLIQVEGKTEDGAPFQQTTSFRVIAATPVATEIPTQAATEEPAVEVTVEPESLVTQDTLEEGQTVPCENLLKGTYEETVTDPIWPVIYIGARYHFQDDNGEDPLMENGKWFGTIRFGDCSQPPSVDRGKHFQLLIITAGPACQEQIAEYFTTSRATGDYPGLRSMADDCHLALDPIVVIRE